MKDTKIALGTWAWGSGAFGGDAVYGLNTNEENLKPVFEAAAKAGLGLWDTATVYAMGDSERILGQMYWIHNPMDVERWTPGLSPLLQSGKVRQVGVSNHNIREIERANEILGQAGFRVSAVQNHFSLLYRSSERGGVLDYCHRNDIRFWSYMVLEQGALTGHFSPANPLPADSDRGRKYNPVLDRLQALTDEMKAIGEKYGASCSQIGIAWAIAKGTMPIVGATKERHVVEAAAAADIALTAEEVARLETLADTTGIDTRGDWEHTME